MLDFAATYINVYIRYHALDMVLLVDRDAAYLILPNAKSHIAGYFQLNDYSDKIPYPKINGTILVEYKTLKYVISFAAEAEIAGLFLNTQVSIPIQYILE